MERQATDCVSETLGHRAKGSRVLIEPGEPELEVRERRVREGGPIAKSGRPLEGENSGEDRLRGEGNTELRMNGLAGGLNP
jgi:hypothetical protein